MDTPAETPAKAPKKSRTDLVTIIAAARSFGVSRHTIRNWIDVGYLDAVLIGPDKTVKIRRASVEARLAEIGLEPEVVAE